MRRDLVSKSRFLSLVLRHDPGVIDITLDAGGWVAVDDLVAALRRAQSDFTRPVLDEIVATNDRGRFVFSEDGQRIRAAQGHSIGIDLELPKTAPPTELFHGTAERNLESIREGGLLRRERDHVHLSATAESARVVGSRHGRPVVLRVDAGRMCAAGYVFYVAANGVWLTLSVPAEFIREQR